MNIINPGKPATFFLITIEFDNIVIQYDGTHGGKVTRYVSDLDDLRQFLVSKTNEAGDEPIGIFVSSTIDFAPEHTNKPATLALAALTRKGGSLGTGLKI